MALLLHLINSEQEKHESVLKIINSQSHLKKDQFSENAFDANSVLSNYQFDESFNKSNPKCNKHDDKRNDKKNKDESKKETSELLITQIEFNVRIVVKNVTNHHPSI